MSKTLEVLLGCQGKAPDNFPGDIARCEYCCGGTAGEYTVTVSDTVYHQVMFEGMTTDNMVSQHILPPSPPLCPRGAVRYWGSSVIGK